MPSTLDKIYMVAGILTCVDFGLVVLVIWIPENWAFKTLASSILATLFTCLLASVKKDK